MNRVRKIKLSEPSITQESISDVVAVLESGWLTQGSKVAEFEDDFKKYMGTSHALAVNSATSGLHLALMSLGIGLGDEVIVPSFTWVATANAVELCGAKPIFVDIDLETLNINSERVLEKISAQTKAIIVVHLFGKPFDVENLKSKLPSNIYIVEDAACAAGAAFKNQYCGTLGDIGVYSFHPRKSITTGEGGMVVTNNTSFYKKMSMLRNHGQDTSYKEDSPSYMYDCPIVGLNYRMTDFQAALGMSQFKKIEGLIAYRKLLVSIYRENLLKNSKIILPKEEEQERHSWQSYVVSLSFSEKRDEIMKKLFEVGIETRPGTHAVHTLKYYRDRYNLKSEDLPLSYKAFTSSISLPLHNNMTADDVNYVSQYFLEVTNAA